MLKDIILQGGHIQCPICGNTFDWSYKLQLLMNSELESMNKAPTAIERHPHEYISHISTSDGNVRFIVGCQKCGYSIETETMKLMDEANYKKYKS